MPSRSSNRTPKRPSSASSSVLLPAPLAAGVDGDVAVADLADLVDLDPRDRCPSSDGFAQPTTASMPSNEPLSPVGADLGMQLGGDASGRRALQRGEQPLDRLPAFAHAATAAPLGLDLVAHRAAGEVVVDDPDRLHQRVGGGRADEPKAAPPSAPSPAPSTPASSPARRRARAGARSSLGPIRPRERRQRVAAGRAARGRPARWRSPPRSWPGCGRSPASAEQPLDVARRRTRPRARTRSRRTRRGSSRACAGSSATRGPTGTPPASAARRSRGRR